MYQKLTRVLRKLHRGQRGMTGLETAIILIAFVTVASVLAYSVLSAGIFSAERGKATVYSGLEQAQATLQIEGSVLGTSTANISLATLVFNLGLTIPDEEVDMGALVFTYYDNLYSEQLTTSDWTSSLATGSQERGASGMLENDEIHTVTVTIPGGASVTAYDWATIQIIPPTGATLTIKRTMPGQLKPVMDLQ